MYKKSVLRKILFGFAFPVLGFALGGIPHIHAAELNSRDIQLYDTYIDNLCSAAITDEWNLLVEENEEYSTILDITSEEGFGAFEEQMVCFWDNVMIERTKVLQQKFNPIFEEIGSEYAIEDYSVEPDSECTEAIEILAIQKYKGAQETECPDQNVTGALDFCEVSQGSYRELCALELWVLGKKKNGSLAKEVNEIGSLNQLRAVSILSNRMDNDLEIEKKAITQSVWDYFYWDQSTHHHYWFLVTLNNLSLLDSQVSIMRKALLTWPKKMIDSASYQSN